LKSKILYIILPILFLFNIVSAQNYNKKNYSIQDGLAQSQVLSLFQDSLGNLWIGTNGGGISVYNGKEFITINEEDGLVGTVIYSITSDKKGNLWFGTDKGAIKYNGFKFETYNQIKGMPHNWVYSVAEDNENRIWFGTDAGAAYLENGTIKIFDKVEKLKNANIWKIYFDKFNNIWFGTLGQGVFKYNKEGVEEFIYPDSLKNRNSIRSITQHDVTDEIYIGTYNGVLIYDGREIRVYEYEGKEKATKLTVMDVAINEDKLWLARYDGKLIRLEQKGEKIDLGFTINLGKIFIYCMIVDAEGNTWVGSNNGLYKIPRIKFYNIDENLGLQNNSVYSICKVGEIQDTSEFFIGTNKKGFSSLKIDKYNDFEIKILTYDENSKLQMNGQQVSSLIKTSYNRLWIGTNYGLTLYDNAKKDMFSFVPEMDRTTVKKVAPDGKFGFAENLSSEEVRSFYEDSKNVLWVGTGKGITKIIDTTFYNFNNEFKGLEDKIIWNIFEDNNHNFWFSTYEGLYVFNGKNIKHIGEEDGFIDDKVNCVLQDGGNNYWIATKKGVYKYNYDFLDNLGKTKPEIINTSNGLSSNNIYLMVMDDNENLFIGSEKGIDILNTKLYNASKKIEIRNYGELDGFMGQECNINAVYKDNDGKIYFGTVRGLTIYDPKYDIPNRVQPITQITNIQMNFKNIDWSPYSEGIDSISKLPKKLVLPYNKNHITFEFVAASLTVPEKVKYQYKLEGLNEEWSPAKTKNEADYPSLPDGVYKFKVRACNSDGVWSENPTVFEFEILPPYWKTWWFYTIITIISIILIYIYIKRREASLLRDKEILEQKVEERTEEVVKQKEIVEQKNKDITDSINYAKNIQEAVLVSISEIKQNFDDSFVLYKPRDIVSGDFYWYSFRGNSAYIAAADCTGHGVPGAFMSMLGMAFLNEIVSKDANITANQVLNKLRQNVIDSLHQTGEEGTQKDGMDITLCKVNKVTNELQYAGANNPLYIVRDKNHPAIEESSANLEMYDHILYEIKADKMPIGYHINTNSFSNHSIVLSDEDSIYLFSDGYPDQFGGPDGKKFKYKPMKEMFLEMHDTPMYKQRDILDRRIVKWIGDLEQIDDILVIGLRVK